MMHDLSNLFPASDLPIVVQIEQVRQSETETNPFCGSHLDSAKLLLLDILSTNTLLR